MKVIDGHTHMYQLRRRWDKPKNSVKEIEGFDINYLLKRLDELEVSQINIMPQTMARVQEEWLGSNELAADIQQQAPTRIISFAAAEPLDQRGLFNRASLEDFERGIIEKGLKGLLLTPPYGVDRQR